MVSRTRLLLTAAVTTLLASAPAFASAPPALARGSARQPTPAQVRAAVKWARRSPRLWATVNICNSTHYPGVIGIRAQMPGLGFASHLVMVFRVEYWNFAHHRFESDPGVTSTVDLGRQSTGLRQRGVMFRFAPPAVLSGAVTFRWLLGSRTVGTTTRLTAHGVKGVDFGDPPGYSTATCRIGA